MARKTLFIDTMVLLQYRWVDQINWCELVDASEVAVFLAPTVLRELDRHKTGDSKRLRDRSRYVLSKLREARSKGCPYSIRQSVTLNWIADEPPSSVFAQHNLDPDWQDDRLLASVLEFAADHPDEEVAVVTEDFTPGEKARGRGLPVYGIPDEYLLPEPEDPVAKRVQVLQRENAELRSRTPILCLTFHDEADHMSVPVVKSLNCVAEESQARLAEIMDMHQTIPPFSSYGMEHPNAVQRYNMNLSSFYRDYGDYVRQHLFFWSRTVTLRLAAVNKGNCPANDVLVVVRVPNLDTDVVGSDILLQLPSQPTRPQEPDAQGRISSPWNADQFPPVPPPPNEKAILTEVTKAANASEAHRVSYRVNKLRHGIPEHLPALHVIFSSLDNIRPFRLDYEIHADNLPSPVSDHLDVSVVRELEVLSANACDVDRREPALKRRMRM